VDNSAAASRDLSPRPAVTPRSRAVIESSLKDAVEEGVMSELLVAEDTEGRVALAGALQVLRNQEHRSLFVRKEASACFVQQYALTVPDLLQTRDVAREVVAAAPGRPSEAEVAKRVDARIARQDVLFRQPPPDVRVILDEAALYRPTAEVSVWREQLSHLVSCVELNLVTLQLLPLSAGVHGMMDGSLCLLWQQDGGAAAWLESATGCELTEDPQKVAAHRLAFERIRERALPAAATRRLIEQEVQTLDAAP
jgi:hypothetical protein